MYLPFVNHSPRKAVYAVCSMYSKTFSRNLKFFFFYTAEEAVVQRCSVKKVFFEISQNSQENTCARVSFLIELQVFINTFFHRTPLVAASAVFFLLSLIIFSKISILSVWVMLISCLNFKSVKLTKIGRRCAVF